MHSGTGQPKDNGHRRDADAARVYRVAVDRFAGFQRLYFYTFPLHMPEGTSVYSLEASRAARAVSETLFGSLPARWKLEQGAGKKRNLHIHMIAPLPPVAVVGFQKVEVVYNLRKLCGYFAKPRAAPLCTGDRLKPHTPDAYTRAQRYRDALQEQCEARAQRQAEGFSRLPPCSGWTGRRAAPVPLLLRLRVLIAFARLLLLLACCPVAPVRPAVRRPGRRPAPLRALRPYRPRARAPDRPRQGSTC